MELNLRQTRPLTYLSFWLNYRLGGENPFGYHAVNLFLHAAAVLVLYELLTAPAILLPVNLAFWAALIFAVHPIQAEAVNYVWARSIVLAAVFTFAAWREWNIGASGALLRCSRLATPPRRFPNSDGHLD